MESSEWHLINWYVIRSVKGCTEWSVKHQVNISYVLLIIIHNDNNNDNDNSNSSSIMFVCMYILLAKV